MSNTFQVQSGQQYASVCKRLMQQGYRRECYVGTEDGCCSSWVADAEVVELWCIPDEQPLVTGWARMEPALDAPIGLGEVRW